jgi:putative lipoic acid-binding regulatory protein
LRLFSNVMDKKSQEFFDRLRTELQTSTEWPSLYLFKFIVPTDREKIEAVENAFNGLGAVITTNKSKNGTYTAVSVNVQMESPDHVIEKYLAVYEIEGIISL